MTHRWSCARAICMLSSRGAALMAVLSGAGRVAFLFVCDALFVAAGVCSRERGRPAAGLPAPKTRAAASFVGIGVIIRGLR